jgi:2-dehydro-3-deoxy-D-gluconate 5-dehydrogenase
MNDLFRLDGRVALVTGASQGLGQGMALALAEAGADVVGLDRCTSEATAAQVRALGRRYCQVCCDLLVTPVAGLGDVVSQVVADMGRLDILVNNAGIIRRGPALDFSEADWDDVLHINLKAMFFLSQAAGRAMVSRGSGGKIINIASMLSFQGGINVVSYAAAKSGVAGLTHALANEWAKHGINVNAIAPGYMATENTAPLRADPVRTQAILDRIPMARWGTPADLAGVVVFLASAASNYMSGAVVPVDGGWLAR